MKNLKAPQLTKKRKTVTSPQKKGMYRQDLHAPIFSFTFTSTANNVRLIGSQTYNTYMHKLAVYFVF